MRYVKSFIRSTIQDLETEINFYIQENNLNLISLQFSVSENLMFFSAMIIVEETE